MNASVARRPPPRPASRGTQRPAPPRLRAVRRAPPPTFVGRSPEVLALLQRADRLARTDVALLLQGESGTGKEILARRVHAESARRDGPLVAESCAAISPSLFESELFGHAHGAFTGADRDRPGLLRRASGGTLLLDEIGELPLVQQGKLLRVLEERRVRPVGASQEQEIDVRLISATNRDLAALVRDGRFREDLYYRLLGARLEIPPLRDRPGDLAVLALHFLEELNRTYGTAGAFAAGELERLAARRWPGNASELRNAVHAAYHASDGGALVLERADETCTGAEASLVVRAAPLASIERDAILLALRERDGSRERAARLLGISHSSIYDRIRRHGIG